MFAGKNRIRSAVEKDETAHTLTYEVNRNVEMIVEPTVPH